MGRSTRYDEKPGEAMPARKVKGKIVPKKRFNYGITDRQRTGIRIRPTVRKISREDLLTELLAVFAAHHETLNHSPWKLYPASIGHRLKVSKAAVEAAYQVLKARGVVVQHGGYDPDWKTASRKWYSLNVKKLAEI